MPAKAMPTVPSLILDKIDHLETNLSGQIHDMNANLGGRITELAGKVQVQNGRISTMEVAHGACQVERRQDRENVMALSKRRVAILGGSGLISGAVLVEVIRWARGVITP